MKPVCLLFTLFFHFTVCHSQQCHADGFAYGTGLGENGFSEDAVSQSFSGQGFASVDSYAFGYTNSTDDTLTVSYKSVARAAVRGSYNVTAFAFAETNLDSTNIFAPTARATASIGFSDILYLSNLGANSIDNVSLSLRTSPLEYLGGVSAVISSPDLLGYSTGGVYHDEDSFGIVDIMDREVDMALSPQDFGNGVYGIRLNVSASASAVSRGGISVSGQFGDVTSEDESLIAASEDAFKDDYDDAGQPSNITGASLLDFSNLRFSNGDSVEDAGWVFSSELGFSSPNAVAVPEPSGAILVTLILLATGIRRYKKQGNRLERPALA